MTTLEDVRATLIQQGYPPEHIDAMLNLAGRMVLGGSFATKDDLAQLREELAQFKLDAIGRFAELRVEMNEKFAELRNEMNERFAAADIQSRDRYASLLKWVAGLVIAGIAVNAGVVGIGVAVIAMAG